MWHAGFSWLHLSIYKCIFYESNLFEEEIHIKYYMYIVIALPVTSDDEHRYSVICIRKIIHDNNLIVADDAANNLSRVKFCEIPRHRF